MEMSHETCASTSLPYEPRPRVEIPRKYFLSLFQSLRLNNQLNHGGQALILTFPGYLVFKCPIRWGYDGCLPPKTRRGAVIEEAVAAASASTEKDIFHILCERPHRNIIQAIMVVEEGIFLPRICSALEDRMRSHRHLHYRDSYVSDELRIRWITQITSAAAWLEALGYAHGHLTPREILLDHRENIKVCDFGESVRLGQESQCGSPPYVPWIFETRGHKSEQYAIGWTIYSLYKSISGDFKGPESLDTLDQVEFPALDDISPRCIIQRCWSLQYDSISALHHDVQKSFSRSYPWYSQLA